MMAPGLIAAAVQIKRPDLRLLPIEKTRFVDKPDHEPNTDQEAGKQNGQASRLPGSAIVMHQTEQVRHSPHLSHEKVLTLQTVTTSVYWPLLTNATEIYWISRGEVTGISRRCGPRVRFVIPPI